MKNEITNCGLVALSNISTLRDVSMRSLIFMAEDNGLKLYPYKVPLDKINEVELPAIFHAENHFVFINNYSELKYYNLTGNVLLPKKCNYKKIPAQYLKSVVGATGAVIGIGLSAVSIGAGLLKDNNANKANKTAQAQVKPYKTPQAVYDVLAATQNNAQSGFDPGTLNYLTSQTDNAFSSSLSTAQRLGADPNAMSAIFGQKVDAISGIAANDHQLQMSNFSAYINALNATGANSAAEQKSQQDILKNQLQKIAQDKADATQQIGQGINAGISAYSNYQTAKLYTDKGIVPPTKVATPSATSAGSSYERGYMV